MKAQGAIKWAVPTTRRLLGQAATEYLVLMSVVLGIALICVALLVWPTGSSRDTKQAQSDIKNKIAALDYPDLLQGLVAYYKFDEGGGTTSTDIKSGASTSLVGGSWVGGKSNNAVSFSGAGGSGATGGTFSFPSAITISMWVKPTSSGTVAYLGNEYVGTTGFHWFTVDPSSGLSWLYADGSVVSTGYTTTLSTSTWTHVAVSHEYNGSIKFYVNGALKQTTAGSTSTLSISSEPLYIGRFYNGGVAYPGAMDELIIFNRVLTDNEVRFLYQYPGYP